ncbi:MAG: Gfo/Idh/MocA family oxidoreductase [Anaerolineae bacterium]|nr:Gfo/Idh/MocA family oxidoreductase [Anaerolineae bacterium]
MAASKVQVGIIGTGNILGAYVRGTRQFEVLDLVACADIDVPKAEARAEEFDIPRACTVDQLLADPEIRIVINLTVPAAHAEVSLKAIAAGKSVQSEKPLAVTREDGRRILAAAKEKGVLVGCAPDTFLGGGQQTCRKLIDDGAIGRPVAAAAFMLGHGPERWHPNPDFFYQAGGGPMFDMGPYYLTALVNLLGPARRVTGSAQMSFEERVAGPDRINGRRIPVDIPTHIAGVIDFASGAVGTLITSFDVWGANLPRIEIYGSEGSLSVPDPNTFGGPVRLRTADDPEWQEVAHTHSTEVGRGIGVADMAYALLSGRPHRTHGRLAYHVLDLMHAFHDASYEEKHIHVESTCERPAALPVGLAPGTLDQ